MKKLILISCYFGKLPNYFQPFLDSCSWNSNIDFLIFSDDKTQFRVPSNVKIEYLEFSEIQNIIFSKIGKWAKLSSAYKLCDYKPTYGLLFQEKIKDYAYWGHCDIDLIWGRLEKFVFPLLEEEYDRIFRNGHLTIYRNNDKVNESFKLNYSGLNFKAVYSTDIHCGFDEMSGTWLLAQENGLHIYEKDVCIDLKRPSLAPNLASYTSIDADKQCFLIQKGCVNHIFLPDTESYQRIENAYIHFQQRKVSVPSILDINKSYQFLYNRIEEIPSSCSIEICLQNNFQIFPKVEILKRNLKNLKKSIRYKIFKLTRR